jgi:hypothetical protein
MGRIAGIGFFVVLLWLGLRIYTEGSDSVLAMVPGYMPAEPGEEEAAPLDALRERGHAAVQQQLQRMESQLGDTAGDDEPSSGGDGQD